MNPRRLFLIVLIASVAISSLLGIFVLLVGNFGDLEVRVLMTTLTVTVLSILGLVCGAYLETGRGRYLPIAGIVLSVVSALMCFFIIWDVLDDDEVFIKSFLTCTLLATACSHLSLLSLARLDRRFSWTRITAVVCVVLLCAIFLYILWWEPIGGSDLIYRILGILGIVLASITVITPILHKLSSDEGNVAALDREIEKLKERLRELEAEKARLDIGES
jgi:hypothetical protein